MCQVHEHRHQDACQSQEPHQPSPTGQEALPCPRSTPSFLAAEAQDEGNNENQKKKQEENKTQHHTGPRVCVFMVPKPPSIFKPRPAARGTGDGYACPHGLPSRSDNHEDKVAVDDSPEFVSGRGATPIGTVLLVAASVEVRSCLEHED
ncbi:hypothetical protein E4U53_004924, partial [Claviceps sorghi]